MGRVLIAGCGYIGVATADLFHAAQMGGGRLDALAGICGAIGGKAVPGARGGYRGARRGGVGRQLRLTQ